MLKRIVSLILIILLLSLSIPAFAAIPGYTLPSKDIKVFIDSKEIALTLPILCNNNRTLYPFRELLENIGAEVSWDQKNLTAKAYYEGIELAFPLEQDYYFVNGEKRMMDTKTTSDPDTQRTYIPIRYAFEALGYDVDWIPCKKHNEIRISNLGAYEPVSDEMFVELHNDRSDDNLRSKYTTSSYYDIDVDNKKLLFKDSSSGELYKNYELKEDINPNINRQVYDLTKALIGDDQFIYVQYVAFEPYKIALEYAKNMNRVLDTDNVTYFNFYFYERKYFNT